MKILFVIATLDSGGAERVVTHLANYLSRRHEITIATFWNEEPFYPLDQNIEYISLDIMRQTTGVVEKARYFIKRVQKLRTLFKERDPDVIISFLTETNIIATVAAKLAKKPIIISERIAYDFLPLRYLQVARRLVYPLADALVTQTKGDKQNYKNLCKVFVIPNPLNIAKCLEIPKESIILGVGRLEEQKGFDDLISAFITADLKNWRLVIAGEGSLKEQLESLVQKSKVDNIEFIGRRKDIFDWYAKASIFAMSSRFEGFPNALLEAMACRCACVSYDCKYGPAELLGSDRGILVKLGDKEALASALQQLANNATLRNLFTSNAQKYARKQYSIDKIAKKWEDVIKEVVKE